MQLLHKCISTHCDTELFLPHHRCWSTMTKSFSTPTILKLLLASDHCWSHTQCHLQAECLQSKQAVDSAHSVFDHVKPAHSLCGHYCSIQLHIYNAVHFQISQFPGLHRHWAAGSSSGHHAEGFNFVSTSKQPETTRTKPCQPNGSFNGKHILGFFFHPSKSMHLWLV